MSTPLSSKVPQTDTKTLTRSGQSYNTPLLRRRLVSKRRSTSNLIYFSRNKTVTFDPRSQNKRDSSFKSPSLKRIT